jgi:GTP-binding protein
MPNVLILGRPNVGKSALFNRLTMQRKAIVHEQAGVTRDPVLAETEWRGRHFTLIDSGGLDFLSTDEIAECVQQRVHDWIERADLVLFVVDGQLGTHPLDMEISRLLHESGKPVVMVVNKVDSINALPSALDFYGLGWPDPIAVSSLQSFNIGDLLDRIVDCFPALEGVPGMNPKAAPNEPEVEVDPSPLTPETEVTRIAIVGRPNVGKSSLLNALLGEERAIVSTIPGTTRDIIDTTWNSPFGEVLLVDTAGIRHKSKVDGDIEYYSVLRATRALERSDLAFLVIDGTAGILGQDRKIGGLIQEAMKPCLILVNKTDQVAVREEGWPRFVTYLRRELDFLAYAAVLAISAKTGWNLDHVPTMAEEILRSYRSRFTTGVLNRIFRDIQERHPPSQAPGKLFKIFYATQTRTGPPTFLCFVNRRENLHFSYERYLLNELTKELRLVGTPIRLEFRSRVSRSKGKD